MMLVLANLIQEIRLRENKIIGIDKTTDISQKPLTMVLCSSIFNVLPIIIPDI